MTAVASTSSTVTHCPYCALQCAMTLTPVEIRHVNIGRRPFGYDRASTEELLDRIVESYEGEEELMRRQCLKRKLYPDDMARIMLFLAADDSGAMTNQSYIADGGWV